MNIFYRSTFLFPIYIFYILVHRIRKDHYFLKYDAIAKNLMILYLLSKVMILYNFAITHTHTNNTKILSNILNFANSLSFTSFIFDVVYSILLREKETIFHTRSMCYLQIYYKFFFLLCNIANIHITPMK